MFAIALIPTAWPAVEGWFRHLAEKATELGSTAAALVAVVG